MFTAQVFSGSAAKQWRWGPTNPTRDSSEKTSNVHTFNYFIL